MVEVSSYPKGLTIKKSSNALLLKNTGKKDVKLTVELGGSKAFSVPEKYRTLKIKANGYARIPYSFGKTDIGWPIALSGWHTGGIRLWSKDPKSKKKVLIANVVVKTRSPIFVRELHCLEATEQEQRAIKGNSPPVITMSAVKPGTAVPKNTGEVELSWEIEDADEMEDYISYPGAEVLEPGSFTDVGGWECSPHVTPHTNSYIYDADLQGTIIQTLHARNAEGEVYDHETIYCTVGVGYHNARCPAGGTIHTDELETIRNFLEDIDARLRSNALEDLPDFVEEWNRTIEERIGRGELPEYARDYMLTDFSDMDYLSGRVGTGSLADDILSAMENVLIYIKPYTLPRGYRAGTLPSGRRALCDCLYGRTFYADGHPDCNWIAVCTGGVSCDGHTGSADAITLLHELYHYATLSGDEAKATVVACCVYDYMGPEHWEWER